MRRLAGRTAIVTGAANGIGRAIAERIAKEGAAVVVADVADAGAGVVAAIESAGGRAAFVRTDVTVEDDLRRLVDEAVARFGGVDALVNDAGVGAFVPFEELTPETWDRIHGVNLRAVYRSCQLALPHLVAGGGAIVNVASQSGLVGQAMNEAYCASKGGVVLFTRALARELGPRGVRVNCVCPGGVETAMLDGFLAVVGTTPAELARQIPLRRLAT
ncbi:MAG TPA: SDR family NAD(P)-dependent oxidoreductase, partial [Acidimicrobiia bacterium]|nr:SDR family NAD(P)-dependent oxidoreductase [Acidimicrobiia bacterium]